MDLYWAKDFRGDYWFCFHGRLSAPDSLRLPRLGGIEVGLSELCDSGAQEWELWLKLEDSAHSDIFRALCADLSHATEAVPVNDADTAATVLTQRLWRWQALLRRRSAQVLSYRERLGLFGEILFLRDCVAPITTLGGAVRTWRGPNHDQQDFSLPGGLLEVKSQLATADRIIHISSEDQLDEVSGRIWLCHQRFSTSTDQSHSGSTLNELIAQVRSALETDTAFSADVFEARLFEAGYVTREEYDADRWSLASRSFYEVSGDFPRVRSSDLRPGVGSVSYSIQLDDCNQYGVAEDHALKQAIDPNE